MSRPPWGNDLVGLFRGLSKIGSAAAEIRTEEVTKAWATSSLRPVVAKGASTLQETITKTLQDPQMLQANVTKTTTEAFSRISLVAEGIKAYRTETAPISKPEFSENTQEFYDPLYDPNVQELSIEDIMLHEAMSGHEDHSVAPGGESGVEILAGIGEITDAAAANIGQVKSEISKKLEGFEPLLDASQYKESEITEEHVEALQNRVQQMEGAAFGYNNIGSFKDVGSTEVVDEIMKECSERGASDEKVLSSAGTTGEIEESTNIQEFSIEEVVMQEALSSHENFTVPTSSVTEPDHSDLATNGETSKKVEQFDQLIESFQVEEKEITQEHLQAVSEKLVEIQNIAFGHDLRIFNEAERMQPVEGELGNNQDKAMENVSSTELVDEAMTDCVKRDTSNENVLSSAGTAGKIDESPNMQELSIEDVVMQEALSSHENFAVPTSSVTKPDHPHEATDGETSKKVEQFDQLIESLKVEEKEITQEHLQAVGEKLVEIQNIAFGHDLRIFSETEKMQPVEGESRNNQDKITDNVHQGSEREFSNTISEKDNIALDLDNTIKQFAKSVDIGASEKTVQAFDVEVQIEGPAEVEFVGARVETQDSSPDFPSPKSPISGFGTSASLNETTSGTLSGVGITAGAASGATLATATSVSGLGAAVAVAGGVLASSKYIEKSCTAEENNSKVQESLEACETEQTPEIPAVDGNADKVVTSISVKDSAMEVTEVTEKDIPNKSAKTESEISSSDASESTSHTTITPEPSVPVSINTTLKNLDTSPVQASDPAFKVSVSDSTPVTESAQESASVDGEELPEEPVSNLSSAHTDISSDSQTFSSTVPSYEVSTEGKSDESSGPTLVTEPVQEFTSAQVPEPPVEKSESTLSSVHTDATSDSQMVSNSISFAEMPAKASDRSNEKISMEVISEKVSSADNVTSALQNSESQPVEGLKSESEQIVPQESECVSPDVDAKLTQCSTTSVAIGETETAKLVNEIATTVDEKLDPTVLGVAAASTAAAALNPSASSHTSAPINASTNTSPESVTTISQPSKPVSAEPEKKAVPAAKPKPKLLGRKPLAKDKPKSTLAENAQARKVPHSRLGRMLTFGGLAAGLGAGTIAEMTRRTLGVNQGKGSGSLLDASPFLTEANAKRIVDTLCKVRGAALKLGQMLSIQDSALINPQVQKIFERVRQSADFMPAWQLEKAICEQLGDDWKSRVAYFDDKPFAAASIGQVHLVKLLDGRSAAMKIQYPGVAAGIESDINNLMSTLKVANIIPEGLYVDSVIEVAKRELGWECDYKREATCTEQYRHLVKSYPEYYVPEIIPDLCTSQIFTSELIEGIPVDKCVDMDQDTRNYIGEKIIHICLLELFRFGFMQTDPNWSNFFYNADTEQLALLDFGACRSYDKSFVDKYIHIIHGAASKDRGKVLQYSQELGFLTGHEAKVMVEAHIDAIMILGEAFQNDKPFHFGSQDTTHRIQHLVPVMLSHRMCAPPEESYSLHRKMSGVFLLCAKLNAAINCKPLFDDVFREYKFGGTWKEFHESLGM